MRRSTSDPYRVTTGLGLALALALGAVLIVSTPAHPQNRPPLQEPIALDTNLLARVRITTNVMADGAPLSPGTYDLRLTDQRPTPAPGQSWEARQWVEFVTNGKAVAREIAEVLNDADLPAIGASSVPVRSGTRVEMLKGGEFLRVSVKRDHERYLIYLPVKR